MNLSPVFMAALACTALLLGCPAMAQAEPKAIDPLRVLSFNIRYGTADDGANAWPWREPHVYEVLKQRQPDVIGLQECLEFQLTGIVGAVPGYEAYALGREADGGGEMCAILWRSERFDLIDSGSFGLAPQGELGVKAWDAALPRICSWVQLYDRVQDRSFWVYNAHFDHVGVQARLESAKLILERIAQRDSANGATMPVILLGDFNCKPGSEPYTLLREQLQDCHMLGQLAFDAAGNVLPFDELAHGSFHDFTGHAAGQRIDYVFSTSDFQVLESELVRDSWEMGQGRLANTVYLSDHYPVETQLYFE
jgi:endonuclease/exonuclease/phosphatase family metal-dependent hydrolase